MQPEHDGSFLTVVQALSPNVERKKLFFIHGLFRRPGIHLRCDRAKLGMLTYTFPGIRFLWGHKSFCLGVTNTFKTVDTILDITGDGAISSFDNRQLCFYLSLLVSRRLS